MMFRLILAALLSALWGAQAFAQTVRPSGATIPENLLRISIQFDRPPGEPLLPRLALHRDDGSVVVEPFLKQELWSPDGRTLSILMHPGRVKTRLSAHDELGRALEPGIFVTLILDGRPLKRWHVEPAVQRPLPIGEWQIKAPKAGTRDALVVLLEAPVDALDTNLIAARAANGTRVRGLASLSQGETVWTLVPTTRWTHGIYTIATAPELEDPSGNRQGLNFEHLADTPAESIRTPTFMVD